MKRFCPACDEHHETSGKLCPSCAGVLVDDDEASLLGTLVDGKYEVLDVIARGGMGVVYRARQKYLGREVALKILRADIPRGDEAARRFLLEARAVSNLKSPHTVTIHDFGVAPEGFLYFVMELLDGRSLDHIMNIGRRLGLHRTLRIVLQVCHSLAEAHALRVWHRDIKPGNVFVSKTREGAELSKVLDFGVAKYADLNEDLTTPGVVIGTAGYLSPEQAMGEAVDGRSDIYSLGVLTYEMLTGQRLFTGRGTALLLKQIKEKPPLLRERIPDANIPVGVERAVMKALEKLPSRRWQTIEDMAEALATAVGGVDGAPAITPAWELPEPETVPWEVSDELPESDPVEPVAIDPHAETPGVESPEPETSFERAPQRRSVPLWLWLVTGLVVGALAWVVATRPGCAPDTKSVPEPVVDRPEPEPEESGAEPPPTKPEPDPEDDYGRIPTTQPAVDGDAPPDDAYGRIP